MSGRRVVGVFTSSRADLGPLSPVIRGVHEDADLDLVLIASGTHFSAEWGGGLGDLALPADVVVAVDPGDFGTDPTSLGDAFGRIASGVSRCLAERRIDLLVLLGDRWELLAVAGAALLHGVPLVHLHGGEVTEGAIDERIRHGMTKLADLHLCATEDSARRIRRLGEEPWRIIVTGAPGLDRVAAVQPLPMDRLEALAGKDARPLAVVVYHPETVDRDAIAARVSTVLRAAAQECGRVVVLHPGADPGADEVVDEIHRLEADLGLHVHSGVGDEYLPLLASADVLIGNSSSGIIEAASFGLPVVDVGDRQSGRLRPGNVVHVAEHEEASLRTAIRRALAPEFRDACRGTANPYGDGRASDRILQALRSVALEDLPRKPLTEEEPLSNRLGALTIAEAATVRDALVAIERGGRQIALLVDGEGRLVGTLTDGDVRRALLCGKELGSPARDLANRDPVVVDEDLPAADAWSAMTRAGVLQVPRLDSEGRPVGVTSLLDVSGQVLLQDD